MRNILLTGGSGKLGTEIQKYLKCDAPSHSEMDILGQKFPDGKYSLIIHSAAFTGVDEADKNPELVFNINVGGTLNLLYEYGIIPFVYISSEYARRPCNMYSASKYAGELAVKCLAEKYLIIRTLFKPRPWIHEYAWEDQYTQGDYVDVIAPLIVDEIKKWYGSKESRTIYVGTGRKTMYDLAKQTKPDVKPSSLFQWRGVPRPMDYE